MPDVIALRGRSALSSFRIAKLRASLATAGVAAAIDGIAAHFWHFVEIERALDAREQQTLEQLLSYGSRTAAGVAVDASWLVVPRLGTISPWSSKATEIARNCALDVVRRIERGVVYDVALRQPVAPGALRDALLPRIHDRMTETVLDGTGNAHRLFAHVPPRALATIALHAHGVHALRDANTSMGLALSDAEIAYL
ncbi:MAG: phosphoribosylformylglycinamidine synthase, partial [Betaproteobacteria bacterium]